MSAKDEKKPVGRPPNPMPEPIPDTPENVARAIMQRPPKKNWRYLKKKTAQKGRLGNSVYNSQKELALLQEENGLKGPFG